MYIPCCIHHLPHQKPQSDFGMAANTIAGILSSSAPPMAPYRAPPDSFADLGPGARLLGLPRPAVKPAAL